MRVSRSLAALGMAAAFGMFDSRLTGVGYPWFWVSNMSALWLLLPFFAGALQRTAIGAVLLGLAVTLTALATFYLPNSDDLQQTLYVAHPYVVGGLVTGPLFGLFGHRWWRGRRILGALVLSAAFCLEPLAWRLRLGFVPNPTFVRDLKALTGLALAVAFVVVVVSRRRRPPAAGRAAIGQDRSA